MVSLLAFIPRDADPKNVAIIALVLATAWWWRRAFVLKRRVRELEDTLQRRPRS